MAANPQKTQGHVGTCSGNPSGQWHRVWHGRKPLHDLENGQPQNGANGEIGREFTTQVRNRLNGDGAVALVHSQTLSPVCKALNPGRQSNKFYGPGIFVLGLSMFPPLLAALAMSKEGEQKTILQVYVSSISAHEFLLGKIPAT